MVNIKNQKIEEENCPFAMKSISSLMAVHITNRFNNWNFIWQCEKRYGYHHRIFFHIYVGGDSHPPDSSFLRAGVYWQQQVNWRPRDKLWRRHCDSEYSWEDADPERCNADRFYRYLCGGRIYCHRRGKLHHWKWKCAVDDQRYLCDRCNKSAYKNGRKKYPWRL